MTFDEDTSYNKSRKKPALQLDRVQMHYLLGMEVWQSADGIFLGQRKYAIEILKRFRMMDCMTTPMSSNMKLLSDASSETVDAMMYRQMIGSLMYQMNTRPYIFFTVNTLSQFLIDPRHGTAELTVFYPV